MTLKKIGLVTVLAVLLFAGSTSPTFAKDNDDKGKNDNHKWYQFWNRDNRDGKDDRDNDHDDRDDEHDDEHDDHDDDNEHDDEHEDDEHEGDENRAKTIIKGTVTDSNNAPVNGGSIVVNCGSATKNATIGSNGKYSVTFTKAECKNGKPADATANTGSGSGSNSGTVNASVYVLNIQVLNIDVPEFGVVGGAVSGLVSMVGYVLMKSRARV